MKVYIAHIGGSYMTAHDSKASADARIARMSEPDRYYAEIEELEIVSPNATAQRDFADADGCASAGGEA